MTYFPNNVLRSVSDCNENEETNVNSKYLRGNTL